LDIAVEIESTGIADVKIVTPRRIGDERGFFSEVFSARAFAPLGELTFVQDNHSWSARPFTIRGLHFQIAPHAQGKLVRVARGRIFDVAVDIRRSSSTFGQHVAVELSAANWRQLWAPAGFAHGFCTLEPDTDVLYKVTDHYSVEHEVGLAFDDPGLGIAWPVSPTAAVVSDRDRVHPRLAALPHLFD
jgi:dTDP-4-dehydrorhamnose 3,5-epimerase